LVLKGTNSIERLTNYSKLIQLYVGNPSINNLYLAVNFLQNVNINTFPIKRKFLYEKYQQKSHEIFGGNQAPLVSNLFTAVTNTVMITHIQCMNLNSKKLWK